MFYYYLPVYRLTGYYKLKCKLMNNLQLQSKVEKAFNASDTNIYKAIYEFSTGHYCVLRLENELLQFPQYVLCTMNGKVLHLYECYESSVNDAWIYEDEYNTIP